MKNVLIGLIYKLAKAYFDKDFFMDIQEVVVSLLDADMTGDEKRAKVRAFAKERFADARTVFVDTVIQIVLLKLTT